MAQISYRCHHFPPLVIQHAVWLYLRFTLSYRDVEDFLSERGLDMSVRNHSAVGAEVRGGICQGPQTAPCSAEHAMASG